MDILPQLIANSLIAGSIYAMVALGFNLIFSTAKFFDIGYGALAAVGAYTVFYLAKVHNFPTLVGVIAGVVVAGILGFVIEKFVYKKLRGRKASNTVMLIASLGVFTALQAVIAIFFTSQFQTLPSDLFGRGVFHIGGGVVTSVQIAIFVLALIIMSVLAWFLYKTMFGKAIRAISDDEEVARIVGIDTEKVIGRVFFIGSAIAGLAGILVGFDTGITPTMGFSLLLKGVIAAIVGGVGNVFGGVMGALLLGTVENFGIWYISGEWKDAIAFTLLIIFLIFRPQGIFNRK
ncbi:branched-chain amino acid ABC transporter permease [Candidatus Kaiserbacteria bacterium]|nr:branched-chain amino acid ABC transporter permease [Candidatus Kaiserbacteria bacterium]